MPSETQTLAEMNQSSPNGVPGSSSTGPSNNLPASFEHNSTAPGPQVPPATPQTVQATTADMKLVDVDEFLAKALRNPKDRLAILMLEVEYEKFIKTPHVTRLELPPMTSYHRLMAHRVATRFNLDHVAFTLHNGQRTVVLYKSKVSQLPEVPLRTVVAPAPPEEKKVEEPSPGPKILLKKPPTPTPTLAPRDVLQAQLPLPTVDSFVAVGTESENDIKPKAILSSTAREVNSVTPPPQSSSPALSLEQRQQEYEKARARIFGENSENSDQDVDSLSRELLALSRPSQENGKHVNNGNTNSTANTNSAAEEGWSNGVHQRLTAHDLFSYQSLPPSVPATGTTSSPSTHGTESLPSGTSQTPQNGSNNTGQNRSQGNVIWAPPGIQQNNTRSNWSPEMYYNGYPARSQSNDNMPPASHESRQIPYNYHPRQPTQTPAQPNTNYSSHFAYRGQERTPYYQQAYMQYPVPLSPYDQDYERPPPRSFAQLYDPNNDSRERNMNGNNAKYVPAVHQPPGEYPPAHQQPYVINPNRVNLHPGHNPGYSLSHPYNAAVSPIPVQAMNGAPPSYSTGYDGLPPHIAGNHKETLS